MKAPFCNIRIVAIAVAALVSVGTGVTATALSPADGLLGECPHDDKPSGLGNDEGTLPTPASGDGGSYGKDMYAVQMHLADMYARVGQAISDAKMAPRMREAHQSLRDLQTVLGRYQPKNTTQQPPAAFLLITADDKVLVMLSDGSLFGPSPLPDESLYGRQHADAWRCFLTATNDTYFSLAVKAYKARDKKDGMGAEWHLDDHPCKHRYK